MKKCLIIILLLFTNSMVYSQLKHYLSYNAVVFADFLNREKDKSYFPKSFLAPSLTYKIQVKKIGVELEVLSRFGANYYTPRTKENVPNNSILQIYSTSVGVSFHYELLSNEYIKIYPVLGVMKNWYDATVLDFWYGSEPLIEPKVHYEKESKLGLLSGLNINVPVYKGFYTNTNIRYSLYPTANYNKQNLIWEVGIGYMIQRKNKN